MDDGRKKIKMILITRTEVARSVVYLSVSSGVCNLKATKVT
jgi:hypothetical protein